MVSADISEIQKTKGGFTTVTARFEIVFGSTRSSSFLSSSEKAMLAFKLIINNTSVLLTL